MTLTLPRLRWGILPALLLATAIGASAKEKGGDKGSAPAAKLLGTDSQFAGMVEIPAGEFEMGIDEKYFEKRFNLKSKKKCMPQLRGKKKDEWWPLLLLETPEHEVETEAYAIDRYEVTNAQYKVFLDETSQRSVFTTQKMNTLTLVAGEVFGGSPATWHMETIYWMNQQKLLGIQPEVLEANKNLVNALLRNFNVKTFGDLAIEKQVEAWAEFKLPENTALRTYTRTVPIAWKEVKVIDEIANLPVGFASGDDADDFAEWAGKHVPLEEEWEKAARGPENTVYPWGDEWDPSDKKQRSRIYWRGTASPPAPPFKDMPLPVDTMPEGQSGYGCFHMLGNLSEWTASFPRKYKRSDAKSHHLGNKRARVLRGLAYGDGLDFKDMELMIRTTARVIESPDGAVYPRNRWWAVGFRCAKYATPSRDVIAHRLRKTRAKGILTSFEKKLPLDEAKAYGVERTDYAAPGGEGNGKVFVKGRTKVIGFVPVKRLEFPTVKALLDESVKKPKDREQPVIFGYLYWNGEVKLDVLKLVEVEVEAPPEEGVEEGEEGGTEDGGGTEEKPAEEKPAEEGADEGKEEDGGEEGGEKPAEGEGGEGDEPAEGETGEAGEEKPPAKKPKIKKIVEQRGPMHPTADGLLVGIDKGRLALFALMIKGPTVVAYIPDDRPDTTLPLVVRGTTRPKSGASKDPLPLTLPSAAIDTAARTVAIQIAIPTRSKSSADVFAAKLLFKLKGQIDGKWRESKP